jgi:hypothetical protein
LVEALFLPVFDRLAVSPEKKRQLHYDFAEPAMKQDQRVDFAVEIMSRFAEDTGLTGNVKPQRYLWTDAFAVCNFLELHLLTGEDFYQSLALQLVDQVHQVLGRYRDDDSRSGWISGLEEAEGSAHPTIGGLRIGKKLPERLPGEVSDRQLEWDQDGQYFHYLTKWMHALHVVALKTGRKVYDQWARELAKTAHAAFVYQPAPDGQKQMYWKMSTDLSRPLVAGMGHHDPLEGYITSLELQSEAPAMLEKEVLETKELCRGRDWTTDDPLGLGGLLCDGLLLSRLMVGKRPVPDGLLEDILASVAEGLELYTSDACKDPLSHPAEYRLAFRELGLATGLHALIGIERCLRNNPEIFQPAGSLERLLNKVAIHQNLSDRIEDFWLTAENQRSVSWISHRDINMVMLATSLVPGDYL